MLLNFFEYIKEFMERLKNKIIRINKIKTCAFCLRSFLLFCIYIKLLENNSHGGVYQTITHTEGNS